MSAPEWKQGDLYVRVSDQTGKHSSHVQHHRAWNVDLLLASLQAQYQGPGVPELDRRVVEQVTRHDYETYKGYKVFSKDRPRG